MSIGGSKSKGSTTSTTASESEDWGTQVWGTQAPYLQDLYNRSQQMFRGGASASGNSNYYLGNANTADNRASSALGTQGAYLNMAAKQIPASTTQLQNAGANLNSAQIGLNRGISTLDQSRSALAKFLNPTVDPAMKAYSKALGQEFKEQFLPGLRGDAAVAGGLGGSRQQIASALGSQRAQQSLSEFAANSYAGQQERALQAAQGIGALNQGYTQNAGGWQQNAAARGDIAGGYLNNANMLGTIGQGFSQQAAGYQGLSQNQQAKYDLARQMPWYNLNQYAGLLGMPVQNDMGGWTSSKSTSKGKSGSAGFNFGFGGG